MPRLGTRFNSSLHQRDSRSALFEGYTGSGADSRRGITPSPSRGYGYGYPGSSGAPDGNGSQHLGVDSSSRGGFRPATPNRRGQYSDAVLNELESQNDAQIDGIMGKVRVLKDVRSKPRPSTAARSTSHTREVC